MTATREYGFGADVRRNKKVLASCKFSGERRHALLTCCEALAATWKGPAQTLHVATFKATRETFDDAAPAQILTGYSDLRWHRVAFYPGRFELL